MKDVAAMPRKSSTFIGRTSHSPSLRPQVVRRLKIPFFPMLRPITLACVRCIEDEQRYSAIIIGSSNNSVNTVSATNGYTPKSPLLRIGIAGHVSRPPQPGCLLFLFLRPAWSHEPCRGMFERAVLWKFCTRTKYTQFLEPHDLKVVLQRVQLIQHMLLVPGFIAPSRKGQLIKHGANQHQ